MLADYEYYVQIRICNKILYWLIMRHGIDTYRTRIRILYIHATHVHTYVQLCLDHTLTHARTTVCWRLYIIIMLLYVKLATITCTSTCTLLCHVYIYL